MLFKTQTFKEAFFPVKTYFATYFCNIDYDRRCGTNCYNIEALNLASEDLGDTLERVKDVPANLDM